MSMTRGQVARALQISVRRVRDLERDGRLRPTGKKGHRRSFDEGEVERFARRARHLRPKIPISEPGKQPSYYVDHETAAQIFDRLVARVTKIEIVRELRVHPQVVEQVADHFERMRRETDPSVSLMRCAKCKENAARFCGDCL